MNNLQNKLKIIYIIISCWILFPFLAVWIWVTNPGKCALIWKKELNNDWWTHENK